jgi:hypothetical protein
MHCIMSVSAASLHDALQRDVIPGQHWAQVVAHDNLGRTGPGLTPRLLVHVARRASRVALTPARISGI